MTSRRTNITGIDRLSIGKTKNDRGYEMSRYSVTIPATESTHISVKSFYFGKNTPQLTAYLKAIRYLKSQNMYAGTQAEAKAIYKKFSHDSLI